MKSTLSLALGLLAVSSAAYSQDRGMRGQWMDRSPSGTSSNTVSNPHSTGHYEGNRAFGRQVYVPNESSAPAQSAPAVPYVPSALNYSSMNRSVTVATENGTGITDGQRDRALLQLQQIALAHPTYIAYQRAGAFEVRINLTNEESSSVVSADASGLEVDLGTDAVLTAQAIAKAFGKTLSVPSTGVGNTIEEAAKAINIIDN